MLHAEKRQSLVHEVTWDVAMVEQWLSCVGTIAPQCMQSVRKIVGLRIEFNMEYSLNIDSINLGSIKGDV